jgi:hypothetical protein
VFIESGGECGLTEAVQSAGIHLGRVRP